MTKTYRTSLQFPVSYDESWIVRGVGGELSERWTVTDISKGEHHKWISVRIEELSK